MTTKKSQEKTSIMREVHDKIFEKLQNLGEKLGKRGIISMTIASVFQVIFLLRLNTVNNLSIGFFSWNHVINDAIILGIPIFIFYIALYIGFSLGQFVGKILKKIKLKIIYFIIKIIVSILGLLFSCLFIFLLGINIFMIIPFGLGLTYGAMSGIIFKIKEDRKKIISDLISIIVAFGSIIIFIYQSTFFNNLYTKINDQEVKIEYMNDQYIFSSGIVYSKDGGMKFYGK